MAGNIEGPTNLSGLTLSGPLSCSSNISNDGTNTTGGAAVFVSTVSIGAAATFSSTVSSNGTLKGAAVWASSVSIGGFNLHIMSSTSSLVAPFVVQGSSSSFTIITWAAANPGDQILVSPLIGATVSSISSGLVAHSHCTLAGQVEFRLSNVSTLAQNQSTRSWVFTRIVPSF